MEETINAIHRIMKCPVCNKISSEKSVQCNKGHVMCKTCKAVRCPIPNCAERILSKEPLIFSQVYSVIPKPQQIGKISSNKLKEKVNAYFEFLKCPVCKKIPNSSQVSQCEKGHVLCNLCKTSRHVRGLSTCPICKLKIIQKYPLFFSELVKTVPKPCEFAGCLKFVQEGDNHKNTCKFKPSDCYLCDEKILNYKMLDHLLEVHTRDIVLQENSVELTVVNLSGDLGDNAKFNMKQIPIYIYDKIFLVKFIYSDVDKTLIVYIVLAPITSDLLPLTSFCGTLEVNGAKGTCLTFSRNFFANVQIDKSTEPPYSHGVELILPVELLSEFYNQDIVTFRVTIAQIDRECHVQKRKIVLGASGSSASGSAKTSRKRDAKSWPASQTNQSSSSTSFTNCAGSSSNHQ